jgi:TPR repeat protein
MLAADQGHADALRNLGDCYASGTGVTASAEEAVRWYTVAAD